MNMKLQTIVAGYDGSDNARKALDAAVDLVAEGGTIHLVTAYEEPSPNEAAAIIEGLPEEFRSDLDMLAGPRSRLDAAATHLRAKGIDHKTHFIDDKPAAAILDIAEDVGADMVVVGSRGLGRGTRFIRGSVSTRVASHARTSFMVIHQDDS